ncbi:MAG: outer membrane beta-barrel protein [Bacteroidia bacterium]|nr:outer membrane beta-barrel protein [Bacteroidia bacterium]
MKYFYYFLFLGLSLVSLKAQPPGGKPGGMPPGMSFNIGKVYGKVVNQSNKPLAYASVTLSQNLNGKDTIIGGTFTAENGEFSIEALPMGKFKSKIEYLGFKNIEQNVVISMPDNLEIDMGNIKMTEEEVTASEVEITAEKSQVMMGIDKRVYNVDKNLTATGGTAEDVLKSVPSVTMDTEGNPQLRNNGATVYIDGRPTQLTLNQIPADMIDQVEIMTNPSAKYDAGITGGIINLVMKKNRKPGYNGFVALGAGTGNRYNGTVNLNLKVGKLNFTTFFNRNQNGFPIDGYTNRTTFSSGVPTSYFLQDNTTLFRNRFQVFRFGVDYSVNNRNTLTLATNIVGGKFNVYDSQSFSLLNGEKDTVSYGTRTIDPNNRFDNITLQAIWKKTFPQRGREWTTDVNYNIGSSRQQNQWTTNNYNPDGSLQVNNPQLQKIHGESNGYQITVQSDYIHPIGDSSRVETGVRSFWNLRDQSMFMDNYNYLTGNYEQIPFISQDFSIRDVINAAYINYSGYWKGFGYQAGLRYEQTNFKGTSKLDNTTFGYDFPKDINGIWKGLFPAVYFSKKWGEGTEIQLNLSRKITRPGWMQIMPIIFMADVKNIRVGNPALQPEFINTSEINFNKILKNGNLLSSLYFRLEENPIVQIASPAGYDSTVLITTFSNGTNAYRYGIDNTIKQNIGKSLELTLNANIFHYQVRALEFQNQGWAGNAKFITNYKFPNSMAIKIRQKPAILFSSQLTASYESRQILPQGYRRAIGTGDFALKAELFKFASLTFSVNDILNARRMIWVYDADPTYSQEFMRRRDARYFKVALQFMFGKPDASIFKKGKQMQKMQQNQGQGGGIEM